MIGSRNLIAAVLVLVTGTCTSKTASSETSDTPDGRAVSTTTTVSTVTSRVAGVVDSERDEGLFVLDEEIEPIRSVSPDEVGFIRGACLQHRGIDVTIGADGSSLYFQGIPEEQQQRVQEEDAICTALYPLDDSYSGVLDDEELGRLYDYYTEWLMPCLETEGYSGFDPPSLGTYVESYGTESEWMPYTDIIYLVDAMTEGKRQGLFEACPQTPPADVLFGD